MIYFLPLMYSLCHYHNLPTKLQLQFTPNYLC